MERLTPFWSPQMAGPSTIERPEVEHIEETQDGADYIVTVYDNDNNTVPEVIVILMVATGCSQEEAEIETWEIHHLGKSVVHHGGEDECQHAAEIISQIGIRVEVSQE